MPCEKKKSLYFTLVRGLTVHEYNVIQSGQLRQGGVTVPLKPPIEEYTKNLDKGYRTIVGMLLWIQRNTKVDISTSMAYLCRVMATPSDLAFECMLQVVQWVYQERFTGLRFSSDNDIVPYSWYDASNDRDLEDSLCIGGGMAMMMGASV